MRVVDVLGEILDTGGGTPEIVAHRMGVRFVVDDALELPLHVFDVGPGLVVVRGAGTDAQVRGRGWVALLHLVEHRQGITLDDQERCAALVYLMDRCPKKSISGFLAKTAS